MSDWYGHIIRVEVTATLDTALPPICRSIIEEEIKKTIQTLNMAGSVILDTLGSTSQELQRGYIVEHDAVRTGRLRDSVDIMAPSDNEIRIGTNIPYAPKIHDGTRNLRPRPWSDETWTPLLANVDEVVDSVLSRYF